MLTMCKATNFITPIVFLFLFSLLGPILGARNKFIPKSTPPEGDPRPITIPPAESPVTLTFPGPRSLCKDRVYRLGYDCQDYTVDTKDGYLIRLARISSGRSDSPQPNNKARAAVVLQHGVLCDGAMYLLLDTDSLAIYLADNGFDVWIPSTRGTKYSPGHKSLLPFQIRKYWEWSWDDLVDYELPAIVDYVANKTRQPKIHYIGHSMGALQVLAALADRAPVTDRFLSVTLLAPLGHMNHITSPMASVAANIFMGDMGFFLGLPNFNVMSRPVAELIRKACAFPGVDCSDFVNGFTGQNCCIEPKTIDAYLHLEPQPSSIKTMVHLSQNIRTGVISRFDYGNSKTNEEHYGHTRPPVFRMENVSPSIPLYVAYGGLDSLAHFVDVELLLRELKKNHDKSKIETKFTLQYAHMDFLMARNAKKEVYEPLLPFLKKYT